MLKGKRHQHVRALIAANTHRDRLREWAVWNGFDDVSLLVERSTDLAMCLETYTGALLEESLIPDGVLREWIGDMVDLDLKHAYISSLATLRGGASSREIAKIPDSSKSAQFDVKFSRTRLYSIVDPLHYKIEYRLVHCAEQPEPPWFIIDCFIRDVKVSTGEGTSKARARNLAAYNLFERADCLSDDEDKFRIFIKELLGSP